MIPSLSLLIRRFRDLLFGASDARNLNLFRFLYCLSLVASILSERGHFYSCKERLILFPDSFVPIALFRVIGIHGMSAQTFSALYVILLAALVFSATGLFTRLSLTAAWISFFLCYGTIYSLDKPLGSDSIGHITDSVVFVLWILSVSPGVGLWGADGWLARKRWRLADGRDSVIPAWPLGMVKATLALCYLGAGYWKLRYGGLWWADGHTLQAYLLQAAMENEVGLNLWLARHLWLCALLSVVTLIFETSFWATLLFPSLAWVYLPAGLAMHAMIEMTMSRNYFRYFICPYLAFLSWPSLRRSCLPIGASKKESEARLDFAASGPKHDDPFRRGLALAFISAFLAVQLTCILRKVDRWPFSSWYFFGVKIDYADVRVYRLRSDSMNGQRRWLRQWNNITLSDAMKQAALIANLPGIEEMMRRWIIPALPPETLSESRSVALVQRRARKSADGGFDFVDTPVIEISKGRIVASKFISLSRPLWALQGISQTPSFTRMVLYQDRIFTLTQDRIEPGAVIPNDWRQSDRLLLVGSQNKRMSFLKAGESPWKPAVYWGKRPAFLAVIRTPSLGDSRIKPERVDDPPRGDSMIQDSPNAEPFSSLDFVKRHPLPSNEPFRFTSLFQGRYMSVSLLQLRGSIPERVEKGPEIMCCFLRGSVVFKIGKDSLEPFPNSCLRIKKGSSYSFFNAYPEKEPALLLIVASSKLRQSVP